MRPGVNLFELVLLHYTETINRVLQISFNGFSCLTIQNLKHFSPNFQRISYYHRFVKEILSSCKWIFPKAVYVNKMNQWSNFGAYKQLTTSSKLFCQFHRNPNQIILTNFGNAYGDSGLYMGSIVPFIGWHKLLWGFDSTWQWRLNEIYKLFGQFKSLKKDVEPIFSILQFEHFFIKLFFDNKLLQIRDSPLVISILSNLNNSIPVMRRELLFTVIALNVHLDEL
jgi:hypothetical protein